jgi:hypothetical protein
MLELKIYLCNPKNKDFLYNGTFILPDLVIMTTVCRSDHTIQTAWSKEAFTGSFKKIA